MMPGTSRFGVYFISPLTGGFGESTSGGHLATQFARTGYCFFGVALPGDQAAAICQATSRVVAR
jgi:hypothetical protein